MKRRKLVFLLPTLLLFTSCDAANELNSETFISKLIPNWVSFVAQLGALLVLILVVVIFGYKPIKKIIKKRQD